jgi:hypothetical protein
LAIRAYPKAFLPAAAWYFTSSVGSFSPAGRKRTYKEEELYASHKS